MHDDGKRSEGDVVALVNDLLTHAIAQQASDVHFEPGEDTMRVRIRLDGLLRDVDCLPGALAENVIARLKVLAGLLTYRVDIPQEGSFTSDLTPSAEEAAIDIRVATFPTVRGERAVVRLLHTVG